MKKSVLSIVSIVIIIVIGIVVFLSKGTNAVYTEELTDNDLAAIKSSDTFINNLFSANKDVLLSTTGDVRRNVENNLDKMKEYEIIHLFSDVEFSTNEFATVNTVVEYGISDEIDVSFYKFYLIKENNEFLIYNLEEDISLASLREIQGDKTEAELMSETDMFKTIEGYMSDLSSENFSLSSRHLIGKAKINHNLSYQFVSQAKDQIIFDISNINHVIVAANLSNVSIVKTTYINNGREISILTSLYRTSKGWKIYDVTQI